MEAKHVAIVMDGNRRFAKKRNLGTPEGHKKGADKIRNVMKWARELGIKQLTLYSFSIDNFKRTKKEVSSLMGIFRKKLEELKNSKNVRNRKIRVRFLGRKQLFPKDIQRIMHELENKTRKNREFTVNLAMGYSGRAEIVDAVNQLLKKKAGKASEKGISKHLYMCDEPDLIIRTGGEKRISDFLTWQGVYSEFIFTKRLWPEFSRRDFMNCLKEFRQRERRFGE